MGAGREPVRGSGRATVRDWGREKAAVLAVASIDLVREVETPRPLRMIDPDYTSEAMRAQVQGEVWLEVVVLPDGTVGEVTITKSLDRVFGLDEEAVKAARQWRWVPGTRFGELVPVRVPIAIEFHLR